MIELAVYIPTYNRAQFLKESIKSVLSQTFSEFNLYILDNASDDNTREVVGSFDDSRITYIRHEKNIGGLNNINYALDNCKEKYLVIFHDDDIMKSDFLEKEYTFLLKNKNVAVVSGQTEVINKNGKKYKHQKRSNKKIEYSDGKLICQFIRNGKYLNFPSIMYNTEFVHDKNIRLNQEVGPCADIILYCDIERHGGIVCELPDVIMNTRMHENQDSALNLNMMHVKLINYMMSVLYYQNKLANDKNGRSMMADRMIKYTLLDFLHGKANIEKSKNTIREICDLLCVDETCKLRNKRLSNIIMRHPVFSRRLFHLYKKIKG